MRYFIFQYRELFKEDDRYVTLLDDKAYHNLDEGGTQVNPLQVVDGGKHSISEIQKRYLFDICSSDFVRILSDIMLCMTE